MIELTTEEAKKQLARYDNEYYTPQTRQAHRMAIAALDATTWIPVTEKLPEKGQRVVTHRASGEVDFEFITDDGDWLWDCASDDHVTHWFQLPELDNR